MVAVDELLRDPGGGPGGAPLRREAGGRGREACGAAEAGAAARVAPRVPARVAASAAAARGRRAARVMTGTSGLSGPLTAGRVRATAGPDRAPAPQTSTGVVVTRWSGRGAGIRTRPRRCRPGHTVAGQCRSPTGFPHDEPSRSLGHERPRGQRGSVLRGETVVALPTMSRPCGPPAAPVGASALWHPRPSREDMWQTHDVQLGRDRPGRAPRGLHGGLLRCGGPAAGGAGRRGRPDPRPGGRRGRRARRPARRAGRRE